MSSVAICDLFTRFNVPLGHENHGRAVIDANRIGAAWVVEEKSRGINACPDINQRNLFRSLDDAVDLEHENIYLQYLLTAKYEKRLTW